MGAGERSRYRAHMGAERIAVDQLNGVIWHRTWQSDAAEIRLGRIPDGRWIAWHTRKGAAYAWWDERSVCGLADGWLSRGEWAPIPVTVEA